MDKGDIQYNLCSKFCSYYKPVKKEELACGGFLVVEKLLMIGRKLSFENSGKEIEALTEEELLNALCHTCPFYEGDCDFILKEGPARPCGGFLLLGQNIDKGVICIDDVRNIE